MLNGRVERLCPPILLHRPVPDDILEALALAAPGWPVRLDDRDGISIYPREGRLRVSGNGIDEIADDAWEAAHWVLAGSLGAWAEALPDGIALDAGAALLGDAAVVFAGASHAGKSSLALHLAARGIALLGDDRLIIRAEGRSAVGLGLARKIRTPLPDDFTPSARRLAARTRAGHAAGADVLAWDDAVDRPAGTEVPIARLLLVRREPLRSSARLVEVGPAEAAASLLPLCGRHAGSSAALLEGVANLVRALPVHRLEAPTATAAADLLIAAADSP